VGIEPDQRNARDPADLAEVADVRIVGGNGDVAAGL
jgi:hypothetical protein